MPARPSLEAGLHGAFFGLASFGAAFLVAWALFAALGDLGAFCFGVAFWVEVLAFGAPFAPGWATVACVVWVVVSVTAILILLSRFSAHDSSLRSEPGCFPLSPAHRAYAARDSVFGRKNSSIATKEFLLSNTQKLYTQSTR